MMRVAYRLQAAVINVLSASAEEEYGRQYSGITSCVLKGTGRGSVLVWCVLSVQFSRHCVVLNSLTDLDDQISSVCTVIECVARKRCF